MKRVPHGSPAEVVRDAARQASGDPGATPRVVEPAGRDRMPGSESDIGVVRRHAVEKDVLNDHGPSDAESDERLALRREEIRVQPSSVIALTPNIACLASLL